MILKSKRKLKKEDRIYIYGAATTGAIIYRQIISMEFNVIGFVDMRADEIDSYYNLPVFNLIQMESEIEEKDSCVIIIAIKNVFEHEKIAKKLWDIGFKKLLFRPYKELNENNYTIGLSHSYERLLNGTFPVDIYDIEKFDKKKFVDKAIIYEKEDYVVANIPFYYVYTDNYSNKEIIWGDIPCVGLLPHIGLFQFFNGKDNQEYIDYIKFCKEAAQRSGGILTSLEWEKSVYKNRLDVFNHMEFMYEFQPDFFVKNAVWAQYNEKGYFNIKSGKHRVVYMIVKEKLYIPLKIKKEEYEEWRVKQPASNIFRALENTEELPVILGNPFLYDFSCYSSQFYQKLLLKVLFSIFKKGYYECHKFDFNHKRIVFQNTPLALYADVFYILGFEVYIVEDNFDYRDIIQDMFGDKITFVKEKDLNGEVFLYIFQGKKKAKNLESDINIEITSRVYENQEIIVSGMSDSFFLYAYKYGKG